MDQKTWDKITAALGEAEQAYRADIDEEAKAYKLRLESGDIDTREALIEAIDEDTDGAEWVIYTYKARVLCLLSNNADAYQEEMGEAPSTVEAQACMAMRRDIIEALERNEIDINAPFTCKKCEATHEDKADADDCCAEEETDMDDDFDAQGEPVLPEVG